jgi:hypothetical protein
MPVWDQLQVFDSKLFKMEQEVKRQRKDQEKVLMREYLKIQIQGKNQAEKQEKRINDTVERRLVNEAM